MLHIDDDQNITLTRGDSATFGLTVKQNTSSYDFSNDTVKFTVKKNVNTNDILFQKTFSNGVINLTPSDTSDLKYGTYYYDVQLKNTSNGIYTVIPPSKFIVAPEVTF